MYRVRLRSFNNVRTNKAAQTIQRWCRYWIPRSRQKSLDVHSVTTATLNKFYALQRIQKWLVKRIRLKPVNDVDPITLEPPTPPVFKHFNTTGKLNAFDARTLAHYFRSTGNFIHPVTREPFTRVDVLRLQNLLPPDERNLLQQMPALEAERDASLNAEAEVRVAEAAAQIVLDNINELSMAPQIHALRQLRILYNMFMPDLIMIVSSVAVTYGTEHALRIVNNAVAWLDAQQCSNLVEMVDGHGEYNERWASRMVAVLETTRRELLRISGDLASLNIFFRTLEVNEPVQITDPVEISIVF